MIKRALLAIVFSPSLSNAADLPRSEFAAPGHFVKGMLLASIKNDLGIDLTTIQYNKTSVELLSIKPVSELFARKLAIADSKENPELAEKDYYDIYRNGHVLTVTAKYTFTDRENKRDEFISSALVNDDECSVKYNDYITLSREF
ncbi:Shiga toxin A subunit [Candidatus Pantoea persica]|uniref:Shiga toxin A subunit n=1 Tax=Candidatus Pantoea persica TaxID=2518128 RepID=UPI00215D8E8D|nr:Shiga toxin A subunit [Candidatus Pantoea persica]